MKLPFVLTDRALLKVGKANDLYYEAQEIGKAVELVKKPAEEKNNSLFFDHEDKTSTWVGDVRNIHWDEDRKAAIGDLYILDEDLAKKIDYQLKQGESAFGISPRLQVKEDAGRARDIRFKSFALVLRPAGGDELMLEGDTVLAKTVTVGGMSFGAKAYLYVPDPDLPTTWKLRVEETPGSITIPQLGRTAAALSPKGYRGQRVQLPAGEYKPAAKKLIGLYRGQDVADEDIPDYLWGIAGMKAPTKATERKEVKKMAKKKEETLANLVGILKEIKTLLGKKDVDGAMGALDKLIEADVTYVSYPKPKTEFVTGLALTEERQGLYELLTVGEYPFADQPFSVAEEDLDKIISNFEAKVRDQQVPVDIDHIHEAGAVGWVDKLKRVGGSLLCSVNWTDKGKKLVGDDAFKYLSAHFGPWTDPKSGKTFDNVLFSAALTNFPFVKGMAPVALSEFQTFVAAARKAAEVDEGTAKELKEAREMQKTMEKRLEVLEARENLRQVDEEVTAAMKLADGRVLAPAIRETLRDALQNPTKAVVLGLIEKLTGPEAVVELEEKGTARPVENMIKRLDARVKVLMTEHEDWTYGQALSEASKEEL